MVRYRSMRPIATDTHDFPKLRQKGCIYVDKTMFLHRMVSDVGTNLFFISRPRRFGKSLMVSTLKALFSARRELFKGLAIDKTDEFSYERNLYTLLASQGVEVVSEDRQSNGRADIVAKHKKGIYIFELKVDEPVDRAFAQIREKKYAEPYLADGRPIWLVGLSFDSKTRHLVDCAASQL